MSTDDFFAKVDASLNKQQTEKANAKLVADQAHGFAQEVLLRLRPLAEAYESGLRARSFNVNLSSSDRSISIILKYKDGGHHSISLSPQGTSGRLEFLGNYTNDDGRNYSSTDGRSYGRENWSDELFKVAIEKCIEDYIFYASRHGGL